MKTYRRPTITNTAQLIGRLKRLISTAVELGKQEAEQGAHSGGPDEEWFRKHRLSLKKSLARQRKRIVEGPHCAGGKHFKLT